MTAVPTAYTLQRVISSAMSTLETLRTEHGQVFDTDDDVLLALNEEGIDIDTVLNRLISAALDAKAMAASATQRIDDLQARKARFERREETYRATLQAVMEAVNLKKFQNAEAGLTLSDGRQKVIITDETKLPPTLIKTTITNTPDKSAILTALKAGAVDGAVLSNGSSTLTIRPRW